MNKKLLAIIIAVVLIGGGVAAYMLTREKASDESGASIRSSLSESDNDGLVDEAVGSIRSLFNAGKSQVCTYSNGEESGTLYITDGNLRADMTSTNPEHPASGMIMTKEKQYFWDATTKEGYITQFSPDQNETTDTTNGETEYQSEDTQDIDHEYNYSCQKWNVDGSLFTPPADIQFTDMAALMQQLQQ